MIARAAGQAGLGSKHGINERREMESKRRNLMQVLVKLAAAYVLFDVAAAHAACTSKSLDLSAIAAKSVELTNSAKHLSQVASVLGADEKRTIFAIREAANDGTNAIYLVTLLLRLKREMVDQRDAAMVESKIRTEASMVYKQLTSDLEYVNKMLGLLESSGATMQSMRVRDDISAIADLLGSCKQ